jgi:hypothetical protein
LPSPLSRTKFHNPWPRKTDPLRRSRLSQNTFSGK